MKKIDIYTDGSCLGNPGAGGWGAILRYKENEKELSGGEILTTNNRMELTAVIKALQCLKEKCDVTIHSDSKYFIDSIEKGWAKKWQQNGWMRTKKDEALNSDLWKILLPLIEKHNVTLQWIKGHNGHIENERCDVLAVSQSKMFESKAVKL
ncbi:MAG: ribonuclease HI [Oscillospiraceae bacterium]